MLKLREARILGEQLSEPNNKQRDDTVSEGRNESEEGGRAIKARFHYDEEHGVEVRSKT